LILITTIFTFGILFIIIVIRILKTVVGGELMQAGTRVERKKAKQKGKPILIGLLIVLMLAIVGICAYAYYILSYDKFYAGISVDGIPLDGMTKQEALSAVKAVNQPKLDEIKISLEYEQKTWVYDYQAIAAFINMEEVIDEAYSTGREGNYLDRFATISKQLKKAESFKLRSHTMSHSYVMN